MLVPSTLANAVERCVLVARKRDPRLSVERIADLCGETKWTIYKWCETGNIPTSKIMTFEHATGTNFVTRYLCAGADLLAVKMPTGRLPKAADVNVVQQLCTAAVSALLQFAAGSIDKAATESALTNAMAQLAAERAQVLMSDQPQLDFGAAP